MKRLLPLLLLALLTPALAVTKTELRALATVSQQLSTDTYRFTVEEVLLDTYKGKDAIIVYTYVNAENHPRLLKTIPKQMYGVPVVQQRIPVRVYYVDKRGYMIFP